MRCAHSSNDSCVPSISCRLLLNSTAYADVQPVGGIAQFSRFSSYLGSLRASGMNLKDFRHTYEISERASTHFTHHPLAVRLDCPLSCSQFCARLLVQETDSDQTEDFAFARREAAVALFEFDTPDMLSTPPARKIDAACYRAQ